MAIYFDLTYTLYDVAILKYTNAKNFPPSRVTNHSYISTPVNSKFPPISRTIENARVW